MSSQTALEYTERVEYLTCGYIRNESLSTNVDGRKYPMELNKIVSMFARNVLFRFDTSIFADRLKNNAFTIKHGTSAPE